VLEIIRAAIQGGNLRFIMTIAHLSIKKADTFVARQFRQIENEIKKTGLPHCFLHSEVFMETHLPDGKAVLERGSFGYPVDPDAKFNPVACTDLGAVAATILANDEAHHNQVYTLTGPESLSMSDMAEIYSKAGGKDAKFTQNDAEAAVAIFRARSQNEWYAKALTEIYQGISSGEYDTASGDIETIIGRRPKSFGEFVEEHKAEMFADGRGREMRKPPPLEKRKDSGSGSHEGGGGGGGVEEEKKED